MNLRKFNPLLTVLSILISSYLYGQKCEYLTNEKDEFTGAFKLETWGKLIREFTGSNANIIFRKIDSNYYIFLNYNVQYPSALVLGTDDKLMLKLNNEKTLSFSPTEITTGKIQTLNGISTTQIQINYHAEKEDILTLAENTIVKMRIYFSDGYKEHEIKDKNALEVKKAAGCLIN